MTLQQAENIIRITGADRLGSVVSGLVFECLLYKDVLLVFKDRSLNRKLSKSEIRYLKLIDILNM